MTVLMKNPNFLILDEPTNDLDLLTLQKLEEFLENFAGCLIVVSHDRYFLDKLVDHLFVFKGNAEIKDFWGPYSEYKQAVLKEASDKKKSPEKPALKPVLETKKSSPKKKLSYKEKYEFEQLEKEIPQLELKKKSLEEKLQDTNLPFDELQQIASELGEIGDDLDEKSMRWMELDELMS